MVLRNDVLQVQSLDENGAMCPDTNPLLSLGHGDSESGGLRMEVDNSGIIFTNSYVNVSSGMKKFFFDNRQNFKIHLSAVDRCPRIPE
jgi:hypothetical protein